MIIFLIFFQGEFDFLNHIMFSSLSTKLACYMWKCWGYARVASPSVLSQRNGGKRDGMRSRPVSKIKKGKDILTKSGKRVIYIITMSCRLWMHYCPSLTRRRCNVLIIWFKTLTTTQRENSHLLTLSRTYCCCSTTLRLKLNLPLDYKKCRARSRTADLFRDV